MPAHLLLIPLFADPLAHEPARLGVAVMLDPRSPSALSAMATVSIPLDRTLRVASPQGTANSASTVVTPVSTSVDARAPPVAEDAMKLVHDAWAAAGLSSIDPPIDDAIHRAHLAALLPEVRLRAVRDVNSRYSLSDDDRVDTPVHTYDSRSGGLLLEGRLTFRLDRLIFADDEPALERVRDERRALRLRILTLVVDTYAKLLRAEHIRLTDPKDSVEAEEAELKALEAKSVLDSLTGGSFSRARAK